MASLYDRAAAALFGRAARRPTRTLAHLRLSLLRGRILRLPHDYLARCYLNMVVAFLLSMAAVALVLALYATGQPLLRPGTLILLIPLPAGVAALVFFFTYVLPDLAASQRGRDLDARLPYALNYLSTMASAGITLNKAMASLARQPVYGQVAVEAAWITRDLELFGQDVSSALNAAAERSPSTRFQDFLQGTLSTISSGADLRAFFRAKAEQFTIDSRLEQRKTVDSLSILSEAFVTVVVVAPIMIMVLLSALHLFGSGGRDVLTIGYITMLVLMPLAQAGFIWTIRILTPER